MPVMNFTPAFMATGLVCPPDRQKIEYSVGDDAPGLFVECRASAKSVPTWYQRLKNAQGTNCYKRLGNLRDLPSLSLAKKLSAQCRAEHLLSRNVEVATKADSKEMTLDTFMRDHYLPHAFLHKRSAKKDEQLYRIHIGPRFGNTPLSQITRRDVQVFHNDLVKKGQSPASADHSIKLMRRVLNLAMQWEFVDRCVLKGIELMNRENGVENFLELEALQRLTQILLNDHNRPVALLLAFVASTGSRKGAVMQAKFSEIDIANKVWRVPATNSKSKKSVAIQLNDSALHVIGLLDAAKSEYLFPNPKTGKPFVSISKTWYRVRREAGLNDRIRIHDLRHTFASLLVNAGRSLYEVQRLLSHADPRTTMRYAHLSAKTLQEAANAASVIVPKQQIQPPTDAANMESVAVPVAEPQAA